MLHHVIYLPVWLQQAKALCVAWEGTKRAGVLPAAQAVLRLRAVPSDTLRPAGPRRCACAHVCFPPGIKFVDLVIPRER